MANYLKIANISIDNRSAVFNNLYDDLINKYLQDTKLNAVLECISINDLENLNDYDAIIIKNEDIDRFKTTFNIKNIETQETKIIVLNDTKNNFNNMFLGISKLYDLPIVEAADKIISVNIQNLKYDIPKDKLEWMYEQLQISLQILINNGYKINIFSLSNNEDILINNKLCEEFAYQFQNDNIKYVGNIESSEKFVELINESLFFINLSMEANILCTSFKKTFITFKLDEEFEDFLSYFELENMAFDADEFNAGEMLKRVEKLKSFLESEVIDNKIESIFDKNKTFFYDELVNIKPKKLFKDSRLATDENRVYNDGRKRKKKTPFIYKLDKNSANKLELGCGKNPMPGWIHLDYMDLQGVDVVANLDTCDEVPLPFEDNTIDEFFGSHVIEHISKPLPMMEELHRIAKPGARALFKCPYGSSDDAFENPTHVRQYFLHSYGYFSQPYYWREDYGYKGDWKVEKIYLIVSKKRYEGKTVDEIMYEVNTFRNVVIEMTVELSAVKPIREPKRELQTPDNIEFVFV